MAFQLHNGMGAAFFTTTSWGPSPANNNNNTANNNTANNNTTNTNSGGSRSRPGTSSGPADRDSTTQAQTKVLTKDRERKSSFGRKTSSSSSLSSFTSPIKSRRRASSITWNSRHDDTHVKTDASAPPAIPSELVLSAKSPKESESGTVISPAPPPSTSTSTTNTTTTTTTTTTPSTHHNNNTGGRNTSAQTTAMNGAYSGATSPPTIQTGPGNPGESSSFTVHQHIHELANKRISTLDYLRKAHEGRIYWFNTLLFDKPDLARLPYFDSRRLARRATNYLLLGLSLPTVIDLNSSTPLEFLRSLNTLLAEFESYQQIHTENGTNTSTLSRAARLPSMFRRAPGGRGRRQSGAGIGGDNGAGGGGGKDGDGSGAHHGGNHHHHSHHNHNHAGGHNADGPAMTGQPGASTGSVINFGLGGEGGDLLPGEEYAHLLTPNLPFDPDFFETFATLCDVLIDCYTRLMGLLPTARDCGPGVADLFAKADAKIRKVILHGVVKEFEDASRAGLKHEMASLGKVTLGGLM